MALVDYSGAAERVSDPKAQVSVLVAIAAYNEGPTIGSVVLKAKQYADEVIVVDDGSTDDTAATAALAGAKVLQHARNLGKGMAIRTAWLFARERDAEALVLLDGDYQHDPVDIPRLAQPILEHTADVVLGVRWGKTSGMPFYRRIGKRVLDYATAAGTKNGLLTDSQSGYRAFSRRALFELEPSEATLAIESAMLVDAQKLGLVISVTSIRARYDVDGSTLSPGRHGVRVFASLIRLVSERRPLFFFAIPGTAVIAASVIFAVYIAEIYYRTGTFAIGYAFLLVIATIVGAMSVFTGLLLNTMKRMLEQMRGG